MIQAIKNLAIRGAPAIGIAATAAVYLAHLELENQPDYTANMTKAIDQIEASRPTAVNLFIATAKAREILHSNPTTEAFREQVNTIMRYEYQACQRMAENGYQAIPKNFTRFLTHCNTGSLATYGSGTALGVLKKIALHRRIEVFVDETRPLFQGARLTMWELMKSNITCTLITDNMAAHTIKTHKIQAIIVGADRIAKNGDVANKVGTYNLAILAKHFNVPFYVVAPKTTFDHTIEAGDDIIVEQRLPEEITTINGFTIPPKNAQTFNPAFDVTPAGLITEIITD